MKPIVSLLASAALLGASLTAHAAIVVHTTDFINNASRTNYNGFELIPNNGTFYTSNGSVPYTQDGVTVQQVGGGSGTNIWVTLGDPDTNPGWYPNGGDNGFTKITRQGGGDFVSVGFLYAFYASSKGDGAQFELLNDGVSVLSGAVVGSRGGPSNYLGFSGGGFDEIWVRSGFGSSGQIGNGAAQDLAIDTIELTGGAAVPEPGTLALLAISGLALCATSRKRS